MRFARAQRGFTLIEIVVAFVMLALVLGVSYEIFSTGLRRAGDLEDNSRALVIAQSQLAQAGLGENFDEGVTSGESEDRRFRWTATIAKFDDGSGIDPARLLLATFNPIRVAVRVSWTGGNGQERHLDLATLVVGKAGAP